MALAARAALLGSAAGVVRLSSSSRANLFTSANRDAFRRTLKLFAKGTAICAVGGAGVLIYALENSALAKEFIAHPHALPWPHSGYLSSFDYESIRRGFEVYKTVCRACHSLKFIHFRMFVNVFMTEDEAKAAAAEFEVDDLDEKGRPIRRPCILNDKVPSPYPNTLAAQAANNGQAPPDLSLMSLARHGGDDYMFALLTSYFDPPAGIKVDDGKAYNPYFPGGVIAMPQQLFDEGIEYSDGTPASVSQQAKDVTTFLHWCAEPYHDTRKRWALKVMAFTPLLAFVLIYMKRHIWTYVKSMKTAWRTVKGREPPPHP